MEEAVELSELAVVALVRGLLLASGYTVSIFALNACHFGSAQLRLRLFIVAAKAGLAFVAPVPTHGPLDYHEALRGK